MQVDNKIVFNPAVGKFESTTSESLFWSSGFGLLSTGLVSGGSTVIEVSSSEILEDPEFIAPFE